MFHAEVMKLSYLSYLVSLKKKKKKNPNSLPSCVIPLSSLSHDQSLLLCGPLRLSFSCLCHIKTILYNKTSPFFLVGQNEDNLKC